MNRSLKQRIRRIIVSAAVPVLIASVVAGLTQTSAVEVARKHSVKLGYRGHDLRLLGYEGTNHLFFAYGTADFEVTGSSKAKKLHIELEKPAYFLGWHVVVFREEQ